MGKWTRFDTAEPEVTEPVPIPDIFATGVDCHVTREYVRLVYWADHPLAFGNPMRPTERIVVANVVMPRAAFDESVARFREQYPGPVQTKDSH